MNKKIAIITERLDTSLGGAERSVSELAQALTARGHDVTILAATGQTNSPNTCVLFPEKKGKRTSFNDFAKALKKHLSQNRYDIIHSVLPFDFADIYQPRGGSFAEAAIRNAQSYQNNFVSFFKKITACANLRRTTLLCAERRICKKAGGPVIAALSDYVARQFKEHYDVDLSRIAVIRNGIKTEKSVDKIDVDKLRKTIAEKSKISQTENLTLFLFAANNFRLKGLSCLIKAMATASEENTFLLVAGRDSETKYLRLAGQFGIAGKIIFLGPVANINSALTIADVGALPTYYDPSSRFILEALAAGKPVITTKFNGVTDLFTDNRHGLIIDKPENIAALAQAVSYFSQRQNIKKAAEAIAADNLKEKISISRVALEMESLYNSIIEKRRTR